MAIIEKLDDRGVKGILIDGYLPDFSFYQKKDWDYALKEKLPDSEEYQQKFKKRVQQNYRLKQGKEIPTVLSQSNFHDKLKESLQKKFCKYNGGPCIRDLIPSEGFYSMDRILSFERVKVQDAVYPAFSREIEKAQAEGRNYYFSLAYLDLIQGNQCPVFEGCNRNWVDFMGFEIKREDDYADFGAYRSAAETFISNRFDDFAHEFSRRRSIISKYGVYDLKNFIIF